MSVIQITSDTILDDVEHHFRVSAGPGAGKTHWLVEHIKNVLHKSERLAKTKKIACITYTNIAVETILSRLGTSAEHVEVSTIHSFLYKHIIKPYASFISDEYELNIKKLDGHEDQPVSLKKIIAWIEKHPNSPQLKHPYSICQLIKLENNKNALISWLGSLVYKINIHGSIEIKSDRTKAFYFEGRRKYLNKNCLDLLETDFLNYKKLYWSQGKLHHDDVLFFSYQIVQKYPFALDILRAKFPYFFIDEFQDCNPIQVELLKLLGQEETTIGIIGDKSQSIYGFQGAEPSQFHTFNLYGMRDYQMSDNRRSTNEIISILNIIRTDIIQNPFRGVSLLQPQILVGERIAALQSAVLICGEEPVYSLSRQNVTSNAMKMHIGGPVLNGLFEVLKNVDSNRERCMFIIACIKAVELARENKFKDSIKELERFYSDKNDKLEGKRISLMHIMSLFNGYNEFKSGSLLDFAAFAKLHININLTKVTGGAIKTFYENHSYQQLALCVKIPEDLSLHKTIHKSKGDEFENVLLILKGEADLNFILNPDINSNSKAAEEQRINYVAASRAINRLFISIPSLTILNQTLLQPNFQISNV